MEGRDVQSSRAGESAAWMGWIHQAGLTVRWLD